MFGKGTGEFKTCSISPSFDPKMLMNCNQSRIKPSPGGFKITAEVVAWGQSNDFGQTNYPFDTPRFNYALLCIQSHNCIPLILQSQTLS